MKVKEFMASSAERHWGEMPRGPLKGKRPISARRTHRIYSGGQRNRIQGCGGFSGVPSQGSLASSATVGWRAQSEFAYWFSLWQNSELSWNSGKISNCGKGAPNDDTKMATGLPPASR